MGTTPTFFPSGPMRRTSRARMCSLIRNSDALMFCSSDAYVKAALRASGPLIFGSYHEKGEKVKRESHLQACASPNGLGMLRRTLGEKGR